MSQAVNKQQQSKRRNDLTYVAFESTEHFDIHIRLDYLIIAKQQFRQLVEAAMQTSGIAYRAQVVRPWGVTPLNTFIANSNVRSATLPEDQ
jgi:hypothetical protein